MNKTLLLAISMLTFATVFSQETYIPYRSGKLWGLSDLKGNVLLEPVYDSIETISNNNMFASFKNGKQGAVYENKVILEPSVERVREQDKRFFVVSWSSDGQPTMGSSRNLYYNYKGEKILKEPVRELTPVPYEFKKGEIIYYSWGADNNSEVFVYDENTQKITQFLSKGKPGMWGSGIDQENNELFLYNYSGNEEAKYLVKYSTKTKKYELIQLNDKEFPSSQEISEVNMPRRHYESKNNFVTRTFEFVSNKKNNTYQHLRKEQQYEDGKSYISIDTVDVTLELAAVKINKYIHFNGYESYQHDTTPHNESDKEELDSVFYYRNYLTYTKAGKIGLWAENELIEAQFKSLQYMNPGNILKPYFLVSIIDADKKEKFGIIRSDGKYIIPVRYDEIIFNKTGGYGKLYILKNNGRYGFAHYDGTIIKEPQYDSILPNRLFYSLNIIQNGTYGFYNVDEKFCEPILPYKIDFIHHFNGKEVLKLVDDKNHFVGYADFDGTLYFKD